MTAAHFASAATRAGVALLIVAIGGMLASASAQNAASGTATNFRIGGVVDPGVRGGSPGAGGPLQGLDANEQAFFAGAAQRLLEVDSVSGTLAGEPGFGLGPRFNMNSCAGCHAFPAPGGTSPRINPQVAIATLHGARNVIPPFIAPNGPVREARFILNPDGTPDGGVHDLFVISGRSDAPGCQIVQPNFRAAIAANNIIFRIPTPVFGLGLVEGVPDAGLQAAFAASGNARSSLGISGEFNRSGNDGTITRFGWKAQNKSVLLFAGEAYNVEQGVTNELFPNEREGDPNCQFNGTPEDTTNLVNFFNSGSPASDFASDIVNFAAFARLSAAPAPAPATASTTRGALVFANIGCAACHIATQATGLSAYTGQSNVSFQPFSDFALHDMGRQLADGISQGAADGEQFRTAPLWGVGQRLFFLHDGRTNDLVQAILGHAGQGSEANGVIANFRALAPQDGQALVNYLRSL